MINISLWLLLRLQTSELKALEQRSGSDRSVGSLRSAGGVWTGVQGVV